MDGDDKTIYFWMDEIKGNGFFGNTNDIEKIYFNLELLGDLGKEFDQSINIKLLTVDHNAELVTSMGRFICMIELKKLENTGNMQLFDFRILNESEWLNTFTKGYGFENATGFMKYFKEAKSAFLTSSDLVELTTSRLN